MPGIPSLKELSMAAAYRLELNEALQNQDAGMSILVAKNHFDMIDSLYNYLSLPKELHEFALVELNTSYQTLVLQPLEEQIEQQQTHYASYRTKADLESNLSTRLALKESEGFKTLYWLARANDLQDIVSFIETEKKECSLIFFSETRDAVVSKIAESGDQENIDKLLGLAANDSERISMLNSGIWGACKGGQITILRNIFEEKCQTEADKTSCQRYLTADQHLFNKVCKSGNLDCVEFVLERIPETEHKKIISEVDWGERYAALRRGCRSGNTQVVDRLVKPFSQKEIDRIFLPTVEETKNLPSPLRYTDILSYDSVEINQHILTKVVSPACREKILASETFVQYLAKCNPDEKRLITQVPHEQLELERKDVSLDKQAQTSKQIEKAGDDFNSSLPESKSPLAGPQFCSGTSSCSTENAQSIQKNRFKDSSFFTSQEVEEIKKDKKEKQRCQENRLTKN